MLTNNFSNSTQSAKKSTFFFQKIVAVKTPNYIGKRDSNTHCLTMDVFAIFQLVGFDRRQACLHPAALKSCEKHLIGRCEQFNIRDFCRYKENTAENTCRIFKVFDAITAKISMLNQYGFGSRLPKQKSKNRCFKTTAVFCFFNVIKYCVFLKNMLQLFLGDTNENN